jgi:hypothetical protein
MRLLISTPCFGGLLYRNYVSSFHESVTRARDEGLVSEVRIMWQGSESLIPRGRNRDATYLLEEKFDRLLHIDADIDFTYEDFKRIVFSEKDIIGGIYPLKCFPLVGNFNPLPEHRAEFFKTHRGMDLHAIEEYSKKYAPASGEVEVTNVATGFLAVSQKVYAKLSETAEVYWTLQPDTGERKGFFDFYPCGPYNGDFESEDWGFARIAAEAGFKVHVNTKVLLGHTGQHTYRLGQIFGQVDPKIETRDDEALEAE